MSPAAAPLAVVPLRNRYDDVVALARREAAARGLPMNGDMQLTGRLAITTCSDRDARYAWRRSDGQVEWGGGEGRARIRPMEFRRCTARLTIVRRTGTAGGPDGGWIYASPDALALEWSELVAMAWRFGNSRIGTSR